MPVLTQLNLNVGTEQNPNMVLHDLHDIRISSTDVTTVTRLLGCDAGVNSIAPLTLANAASLLGGVTNGVASPFSFSIHHSGDCRNVTNSPVNYGVIMKCTLAFYPVWMAFASTSEGIGAFWVGMADHNQNELANVLWKKIQFAS